MELHEALRQISDIRRQMARSEVYRGYRSMVVGASGVLAMLASVLQSRLVPSPEEDLGRYLGLWVGLASLSLIAVGVEMARRVRGSGSGLARQMTMLAAEQFLPCVAIGRSSRSASPKVRRRSPGCYRACGR